MTVFKCSFSWCFQISNTVNSFNVIGVFITAELLFVSSLCTHTDVWKLQQMLPSRVKKINNEFIGS